MEIISWKFLFFVFFVIAGYYPLNRRLQNYWLLFASAVYICTYGWQHLVPLLLIATTTYLIGKKIRPDANRGWFIAGLAINAWGFLVYRLFSSPLIVKPSSLESFILPLGFAFYSLQAIAYLVDIRRGILQPETGALDFILYLMFFPKILAGPIERAGSFLPQLKKERVVDNQMAARGLTLIIMGLFRKIAIAGVLLTLMPDNLFLSTVSDLPLNSGLAPSHVFTYIGRVSNLDRIIGLLIYGIYLYNDFAGYTALMRGISLLMGFELSPNFREPFFAVTLSDFWSRWHISLSSWVRDYIFFPLTRLLRRKSAGWSSFFPVCVPLMTAMLVAGLWHGLTIPFMIWGLTYGVIMALQQLVFQRWPGLRPQQQSASRKFMAGLLTFLLVSFTWISFAAKSFAEIETYWMALFQHSNWLIQTALSGMIVILVAVSFFMDFLQAKYEGDCCLLKWPSIPRAAVLAALLIILFLAFTWTSPFISNVFVYQGF